MSDPLRVSLGRCSGSRSRAAGRPARRRRLTNATDPDARAAGPDERSPSLALAFGCLARFAFAFRALLCNTVRSQRSCLHLPLNNHPIDTQKQRKRPLHTMPCYLPLKHPIRGAIEARGDPPAGHFGQSRKHDCEHQSWVGGPPTAVLPFWLQSVMSALHGTPKSLGIG
jgi:hypothetical protein